MAARPACNNNFGDQGVTSLFPSPSLLPILFPALQKIFAIDQTRGNVFYCSSTYISAAVSDSARTGRAGDRHFVLFSAPFFRRRYQKIAIAIGYGLVCYSICAHISRASNVKIILS